MPNTNQILFIMIIVIIFSLFLIAIMYMMNKANTRRRELFDLEQKLQLHEQQAHMEILSKQKEETLIYQPAMVKQGLSAMPSPIIIMTPKKQQSNRTSLLTKLYEYRSTEPPLMPQRPSSFRPPSFLPMKENDQFSSPPAYDEKHVLK